LAPWLADLVSGPRVGSGRQGQSRDPSVLVEQRLELAIVGAEIVAPLADAMRLVNRDQRQRNTPEQLPEARGRRSFGSDVEKVELTAAKALDGPLAVAVRRGQRRRANAQCLRAANLVMHQRDQRRNDQRRAFPGERRQLIAERLARAGRHHRQRMLSREHAAHDVLLRAAEGVEAKRLFENRVRVGHACSCSAANGGIQSLAATVWLPRPKRPQ